jgi:hypothetical protein
MSRRLFFLCCILFSFSVCAQQKITVLFVGNSLTYANNLPELVKTIATCDHTLLDFKMLALPNYALVDHLNDGQVISEIQSKKYDFVVVQQGPSSQAEGRSMLINDGLKFARLCAENNSQLAFYTVWPSKARSFDFQGVLESYRKAAETSNSILCPAGNAWLQVWKSYPEFKLYSEDNFHPSYSGSLLAALVIYGSLTKKNEFDFVSFTSFNNIPLSKEDFNILKRSARFTLKANL